MFDFQRLLHRYSPDGERGDPYCFYRVPCGAYHLSIQGSRMHMCRPSNFNLAAEHYTHFEVAVFQEKAWLGPDTLRSVLPIHLAERFDNDGIAGYMPAAEIQEMFDLLLRGNLPTHYQERRLLLDE
jgi:hypothetical protein